MQNKQNHKLVLFLAWTVILSTSLYKIISQEIFGIPISEKNGYLVPIIIALLGLILTYLWPICRSLKPFFWVLMVLYTAQLFVYTIIDKLPIMKQALNSSSFSTSYLADKSLGLMVTLIVIIFLFIIKKKRQAFYLAIGDVKAPAEPVRWLGIKAGDSWKKLGWFFALFLSLGTLAFLILSGRSSFATVIKALPYLPIVLLLSAMNAFYEEVSYKASLLSVLVDVVGKQQAYLLVGAFFGIWHYYGVPYGITGVLLAGFLGWLLAKSMEETKGMFWAWFLHFLQDVFIFAFLAIGSVTPGG